MQYESCYGNYRGGAKFNDKKKMAESRFASSDEIVVDQLKLNAENKNTTESTQTWLNVWGK